MKHDLISIEYEFKKPYYLRSDYAIDLPAVIQSPIGDDIQLHLGGVSALETKDTLIQIMHTPTGIRLIIKRFYASDGMSVPLLVIPLIAVWVPRRKRVIPGFIHDAFYELMRKGLLARSNRAYADAVLYHLCVASGAPRWIARMFYAAVKHFGKRYTLGSQRRKTEYAP